MLGEVQEPVEKGGTNSWHRCFSSYRTKKFIRASYWICLSLPKDWKFTSKHPKEQIVGYLSKATNIIFSFREMMNLMEQSSDKKCRRSSIRWWKLNRSNAKRVLSRVNTLKNPKLVHMWQIYPKLFFLP